MLKKLKKSNKGVTLTSLVIYVFALTIVMAAMTTMSTFFYTRIADVLDTPKYLAEFNKFTMFFVTDIKNYNNAKCRLQSPQLGTGHAAYQAYEDLKGFDGVALL